MADASFLFLSQEDVVAAGGLDMTATMETIRDVLRLHAAGDTILPPKVSIHWGDELDSEERDGRIMAMPAYVGGSARVAGLKWIPSVPDNPTRGLPRGIGLIVLTDRATGLPLAVMDGTVVSAMRTGAVGGICAEAFASAGADHVTILGAGVQAVTQLMALEVALPLREVRIWDVDPARAEVFCGREERPGFSVVAVDDARTACRDAPVVIAATMAAEPFVGAEWMAEGSLFVSISSVDPTVELIAASDLLVCDVWEHETEFPSRPFARALAAGVVARDRVVELGDVLSGAVEGRTSDHQRIFVSPVGLGIEDVAAAHRVYLAARERGLGTELALWRRPIWS